MAAAAICPATAEGVSSRKMIRSVGDRRWRRLAYLGVALHMIFLMTAQFEHHDLLCHIKTPFHCSSCVSSPLSPDPHTPALVGAWQLADLGRAVALSFPVESAVLLVLSPGRSPPSFA